MRPATRIFASPRNASNDGRSRATSTSSRFVAMRECAAVPPVSATGIGWMPSNS